MNRNKRKGQRGDRQVRGGEGKRKLKEVKQSERWKRMVERAMVTTVSSLYCEK